MLKEEDMRTNKKRKKLINKEKNLKIRNLLMKIAISMLLADLIKRVKVV